jgi:hypothetical protein
MREVVRAVGLLRLFGFSSALAYVYYHTEIPAVSVPNEPIEIVLEAAEQYGVTHLILDQNHPAPLREIYTGDVVHPELQLIEVYNEDVRLFQIK